MRVSKKALSLVLSITMVLTTIPGSLFYASTDRSTYANSKSYSDSQNVPLKSNADSGVKDSSISVAVTGIELNKTALTMEKGTSETLTATIHPDDATDQDIAWITSNSMVCKVDQTGNVTAVGNGTATISVMTNDGGFTSSCKVNVVTTLTGLTLNKNKMTLAKGASESLIATEQPDGAPQQTILWKSSDTSVCTVDSLGVVTAVNPGLAAVSATTKDSGFTATCLVTVAIPVTGITLNKTEMTLNKGKSQTLVAAITPANATDQKLLWESSNENICSVSENGKVTALANGKSIITVYTDDGTYKTTCTVTVGTPVTGITLNKTTTTIAKGSQETLIATVNPSDATNKNVIWQSMDESVCTVDSSGTVSALEDGTTVISAKTEDGGRMAACIVTVVTYATGISLDKTELDMNPGDSETLTPTFLPDDATKQDVDWMSSNSAVCTVDNGQVTAVGNGTATVTVITKDGTFSAACTVNVTTKVTGVSLRKTSVQLTKGTKDTLVAEIAPSEATVRDVTWSSSDSNICSVDSFGNICAIGAGTADITVTTKDGGYQAKCTVTVIVPATGITLNKSDVTLEKGSSEVLTTTIIPQDATDQVFWSTSDKSVCTVDQSGKVTAKGNGSATVTVILVNSGYKASCNITVVTSVTGVTLDKTAEKLTKGSKETLTATITPADASDKGLKWTSSNSNVCAVDDSGTITAVDAGNAVITVETDKGGFTATCAITVVIPVISIALNKSGTSITKGKSETLTAAVSPSDATDQKVSWKSSNETIAIVDQTGKVTALSVGTATITATTDDGGLTAQCSVTVTPNYYTVTANATNGKVDGAGTFAADTSVTLTETPNTGYHFVNWTDSAGNVLGTDSSYTIPKLSANVSVAANFAINAYMVTVTATTGGSVTGGGNYKYGSSVTLTATPDAHYHFTGWSDGVSSATRTVTVTQNMNVTASFAIDTYTIAVASGGNGYVTGGGVYGYGSTATLTAVPNDGYAFSSWGDGNASNPRYVTVTGDASLAAYFSFVPVNYDFGFSGAVQTFTAPVSGTYAVSAWGAQGCGTYGGKGGYSAGSIYLTAGQSISLTVGQAGQRYRTAFGGGAYGYNGGGGASYIKYQSNQQAVIVAGGGGGEGITSNLRDTIYESASFYGGAAGGLNGQLGSSPIDYYTAPGIATQTAGGSAPRVELNDEWIDSYAGSAFNGGAGVEYDVYGSGKVVSCTGASGGGGGYYGGAGGLYHTSYTWQTGPTFWNGSGAGGGSGYIGGVSGGTCQAGSETFLSPSGGYEVGHAGNGFIRVTRFA